MKKLGFVIPWFSDDIKGGAEMALRNLIHHLQDRDVELEVLTTCVKDFHADWNKNYYKEGMIIENQITIRRFQVTPRNVKDFDQVNAKLMSGKRITDDEERVFLNNMIHSVALYQYMKENESLYELFIFTPYMFGITYEGVKICPQKSIMIPCLHDESYAYMKSYAEYYKNVRGMIFLAQPESNIANRLFDLSKVNQKILGTGLDTEIQSSKNRFIEKYHVDYPFMLYTGRKDTTKNVDLLIYYFTEYKKYNKNQCKLLLVGPATLPIPKEMKEDIIDLGFIDLQDKYDAMAAATVLCQPSLNESFSLVIMESWLCGTPVMVHNKCAVTKNFAIESNGGFYFDNYYEFEKELNYLLENQKNAGIMAQQGCQYVKGNFGWDVIVDRYVSFFEECIY